MQTSNRILDDLAKVANGAASAVTGLKDDAEGMIRRQLQKLLADQDLVTREEFEAVKALAANARAGEEALQKRVAALEAQLKKANKAPVKKPSAKK